VQSVQEVVTSVTVNTTSGSAIATSDSYDPTVEVLQIASASSIPSGATVVEIQQFGLKTLGSLVGGAGYTPGTYPNVPLIYPGLPSPSEIGNGALATIVINGSGVVTTVTITDPGAMYVVGQTLTVDSADVGGAGAGFQIDVVAVWAMTLLLSDPATSTSTVVAVFETVPGLVKLWQHEVGVNEINGQNISAIKSSVETNDLGWVSGGPSQPSPIGENMWIRVDRVEPDFIQSENMEVRVTGRPFADSPDVTSDPYVFAPSQGKVDMREQRREMRLIFTSNVQDGDYQMGKVIINAEFGDVRPT
jgi:hypothetical protein